MHSVFVSPNFHVVLIHYPLGLFIVGALIEIFSFLWRRSSARVAGRWMILLGALLMLPTVMSGMYALHDVTNADTGGTPMSPAQLHKMVWHIWLEGGATALAVITIVIGLGAPEHWRNRLHWPLVVVLIGVLGLLTLGSRFGGDAVYHTGMALPPAGVTPLQGTPPGPHDLYYWVGDPLQIHMILVGFVLALTAVGLGLSVRRITRLSEMRDEAMLRPGLGEGSGAENVLGPDGESHAESHPAEPAVGATRFWILAFVLAAMTAGAGYWFWGHDNGDSYRFKGFWQDTMMNEAGTKLALDRTSVHVWIAMAILAMTLTLDGVIHFARPSKLLLTIFAGLLVLLLAAQFWVGILLTYGHAPHGSLIHLDKTGMTESAADAGG